MGEGDAGKQELKIRTKLEAAPVDKNWKLDMGSMRRATSSPEHLSCLTNVLL